MSEQSNQSDSKARHSTSPESSATAGIKRRASKKRATTQAGKSKANIQRAKKRATARKARKRRLIALLNQHDQALKAGKSKIAAKFAAALRKEKVGKLELPKMRAVVDNQYKAEMALEKQTAKREEIGKVKRGAKRVVSTQKPQREIAVAEKKQADAVIQLKRAQKAEQEFFAALMKLTKNGVCPFCEVERLSIDTHVMDVHPPQWGEYLSWLERTKP